MDITNLTFDATISEPYGAIIDEEENVILSLRQEAHICHNDFYSASGEDKDGNIYTISWKVTNPDAETEDESCDWQVIDSIDLV